MPEYQRIEKDDIRHYVIPELKGRQLPSSTTVLSLLSKPALIQWASNVGVEYIKEELIDRIISGEITLEQLRELDTVEIVKDAKKYHKQKKEQAGGIGSRAHHKIQDFVSEIMFGGKEVEIEIEEDIEIPFKAFMKWWDENNVIPLAMEHTVWSQAAGGYAGTLDLLAYINKPLYVLDFKTGKYIYDDQPMQLASYFYAAVERPVLKGLIPEEAAILRLDKETGMPEFHHIPQSQLIIEQQKFLRLVEFWHLNEKVKEIKKSIKKGEKNGSKHGTNKKNDKK